MYISNYVFLNPLQNTSIEVCVQATTENYQGDFRRPGSSKRYAEVWVYKFCPVCIVLVVISGPAADGDDAFPVYLRRCNQSRSGYILCVLSPAASSSLLLLAYAPVVGPV